VKFARQRKYSMAYLQEKNLEIMNRTEEIEKITIFLEELQPEWNIPDQLVLSLNLVIEEAVINTINYGYDDDREHLIELSFALIQGELSVTICDDGKAFDPTIMKEPDVTLSAEDRPIGGLGIHLIRKLMDKVEYKRENKRNYLTMIKTLTV
jgi:anti-sigma regulatory factor (Ser/Thr protein kinase)